MRTRTPPVSSRKLPPRLRGALLELAARGGATPAEHDALALRIEREAPLTFREWAELRRFLDALVPRDAEAAVLAAMARR